MESQTIKLSELGVDVWQVIDKLGGNEDKYLSICRRFPSDINYIMFFAAMEANDMNLAGMYIHTLKGVAANLGFIRMSELCKSIMTDIKNNDLLFLHKQLQELTDEYERITRILQE